jgi:Flp pilus assembly protein TadG
MKKSFHYFLKNKKGVTAIEFAIFFPLFAFILMALVAFTAYGMTVYGLRDISAAAARISVGGLSDSERASLVNEYIDKSWGGAFGVHKDKIKVSVSSLSDSNLVTVRLNYDASEHFVFALPWVGQFFSKDISAESTLRRGGF